MKRNYRYWELTLLTPSLLGVSVFFVIPFGMVLYYSLIDKPISAKIVFLDNYIQILHNAAFLQASKNSLLLSILAVPLAVFLPLTMAVMLEHKMPGKGFLQTCFMSPLMVPSASVVLIWQVLFSDNGYINSILQRMNGAEVRWFDSSLSLLMILLLFIWKNLGYNMILFVAALGQIPKEYLEAARIDGGNEWQIFWKIKMRYLMSTVLFVVVLSIISAFKIFREIYLLTGDYPGDHLYMLQHFMNNTFRNMDYQKLSVAAILMFLVVLIIIAILFAIEGWLGKDVEG